MKSLLEWPRGASKIPRGKGESRIFCSVLSSISGMLVNLLHETNTCKTCADTISTISVYWLVGWLVGRSVHWFVGRLVRRHLLGSFASLPLTYTRRIFLILGIHPAYLKRTVKQKERNRERQRETEKETERERNMLF